MKTTIKVYYDREGDFLEITSGDISQCFFDNRGDGIFEIIDKNTHEMKGVAIFSLKMWADNLSNINIQLPFKVVKA